jgi:hypothetical protein
MPKYRIYPIVLALLACFTTAQAKAADAVEPSGEGNEPAETPPREPKTDYFDSGKLLGTGGVTQLEGAGGSGLVPWALITGYGTRDAIGANAHYTYIKVSNFTLKSEGFAVGLFDRVELSYDRHQFDTKSTGGKLGLGNNFMINQDIYGAKVKVIGDAVYDQDSWLPQIAAGLQYKVNGAGLQLAPFGVKDNAGTDYYLAATKIFLDQSLLLNLTLRETRANQFGILGFGGDRNDGYQLEYEASAAYFFTRQIAFGGDYRTKPNNLNAANEQNAFDIFLAYFFNKNVSATVAYLDMGDVATEKGERGTYLSLQIGF